MDIEKLIKIDTIREFFNITDDKGVPEGARALLENMELAVFEKGDMIVTLGDTAESGMFIILEGNTEVLNKCNENINTLGTGDFIGELALINDDKRAATVRALGHVECAHISKPLFEKIADMNRKIYAGFMNMLYVRTTRLVTQQQKIKAELDTATKIQESMLEHDFSDFNKLDNINIYAAMKPAKEVGGDFYDVFMIDKDRMCFLVADVAGKSVSGAMFMMMAKTHIKNYALLGMPINEVAFRANNALAENNKADKFVTAFLCVLNVYTGELEFADCGHNRPYISRKGGDFVMMTKEEAAADLVLGMMSDMPYRMQKTFLMPGDKMFLYTDGVTEAMNEAEEFFSDSGLAEALNAEDKEAKPETFVENIFEKVTSFAGEASQSDDITMVYLSR